MIFVDEVLSQGGRGHPSFQNDEEPDAGLIELFDGDSEYMYEVGTALSSPTLTAPLPPDPKRNDK